MRKILSVFLCILLLILSGCGGNEASSSVSSIQPLNPLTTVDPYKIVIMKQKGVTEENALFTSYEAALTQAKQYAQNSGMMFETHESTADLALNDMINQAVSGAKIFICIGNIFSSAVSLCSQSYKNLNFILFDGTIPQNEVSKNVLQFSFAYDEAGFILGYCLVNAGMRNIGFAANSISDYEECILRGIVAGAGYAANEKNNPPQTSSAISSEGSVSSVTSIPSVTQQNKVSVTIEKYILSSLNDDAFTVALDLRKDLKNLRLVCIGDNAAQKVTAHPAQFYIFTDCSIEYSRKHAQFGIGGEFDIFPHLELLSTAGEGWANTYGGKTVRFSVSDANILFPVFKMSHTNLNKAKAILAQSTTDLNSDKMKKGFGYVTQTEYIPA